ncbi:MAG TPA: hypothetical protein DCP31_06240, partial [Cyanobacteria bacterium UBA8543]|nr:hypothetical protein [Cyanobacteria bacterium UBA8543]
MEFSQMNNYRAILKKAGAVLVAVGAIDIALWVYCTINNLNYSSNFNILTVVIGILLIRGNLKVAHNITGISAFMLSFTGANLLLLPFVNPARLWVAEFKFRLVDTVISLAIGVLSTVLLAWIYRQLRSTSVGAALQSAGYPTSPPKFAFG